MNTFDVLIIAVGSFGLVLWIRGCRRRSVSDSILGLVLGVVACALYFFLFSLTRTAWLAAIIMATFLVALLPFQQMLRGTSGRMLAAGVIVLIAAAAIVEHKYVSAGNALLVIEPYRIGKGWAFDERRLRLKGEPFVQGIPEMIDKLVTGIPGSDQSVRLIFSQRPFPGAQLQLDRRGEQDGGNWYHSREYQSDGWLCPALFKFFPRAPQHIYVKAEQK
jgi:hypothetical protein